jgi:hypothetical protein
MSITVPTPSHRFVYGARLFCGLRPRPTTTFAGNARCTPSGRPGGLGAA